MKSLAELSSLPRALAFLNAWAEGFADVLQKVSESKYSSELLPVESLEPDIIAAAGKGLCVVFTAGAALRGEQACLVSEADAKLLAQLLMGEAPDAAAAFTDVERDAAAEVFRQVSGQVAIDLSAKWDDTVSLTFDAARPLPWDPAAGAAIRITVSDDKKCIVLLNLQDSLLAALTEMPAPKPVAAPKEVVKPDLASPAQDATATNLDLLLDIELDVTIRFGQREMLLRDVLDLRSGSVIELERHVEEPAELLVAGRPVARGEVVVVEGNYGLRITEILSPRQRYEVIGK